MPTQFGVIDLFAGPGGLAEGFASCVQGDHRPFEIVLSVEKEESAHRTLLLRTFLRQFKGGFPDSYYDAINAGEPLEDWIARICRDDPEANAHWTKAKAHALQLTLGTPEAQEELDKILPQLAREYAGRLIVIGGPPCQAYSLVGRSRNRGKRDYVPEHDHRHYLYEQYISILKQVRPVAFVMENVRGILSSTLDGKRIFPTILRDLEGAGLPDFQYTLVPLAAHVAGPSQHLWAQSLDFEPIAASTARSNEDPSAYLIKSERHGVPQARHRVIVVGVRSDVLPPGCYRPPMLEESPDRSVPASCVLKGLEPLRSGVRKEGSGSENWLETMDRASQKICADRSIDKDVQESVWRSTSDADFRRGLKRSVLRSDGKPRRVTPGVGRGCPSNLKSWILRSRLSTSPNHESRSHMDSDLERYLFAAAFAEARGRSPKADEFPASLAPSHDNWTSGKFSDRFRVQLPTRPSTTVTSHIAKDGHYFIHPDPRQCRSLTVREAARLQTFPDDYVFLGTRTQQYTQVGNAVPPFLAKQIAEAVWFIVADSAAVRP